MSQVQIIGVQAVVFDLDDTLYPERSFAFSGFDAVAKWLKARIECPFDPADRMRELFDSPHRGHVFDKLLEELNYPDTAPMVAEMVECYRSHIPQISLYEDAEILLNRLRDGFRLALISDGPVEMQQRKVHALGLGNILDRIILTDHWGRSFWKPHPRAFQEIERTWGVSGSSCIYIADNAKKDFQAPRMLGWQSVRVRRSDGIYADTISEAGTEPDLTVNSLHRIILSS